MDALVACWRLFDARLALPPAFVVDVGLVEGRGWAVVDILRIAGGYVVEHWDVMQQVPDPADCKNANGMF